MERRIWLSRLASVAAVSVIGWLITKALDNASLNPTWHDIGVVVIAFGVLVAATVLLLNPSAKPSVGPTPNLGRALTGKLVPPEDILIRFAGPPDGTAEWYLDWATLVVTNNNKEYAIGAEITARLEGGTQEINLRWDANKDEGITIRPTLSQHVPFVVRARDHDHPWDHTTLEAGVTYLCEQNLVYAHGRGHVLTGPHDESGLTRIFIGITVHYEVHGHSETGTSHRDFLVWVPDDIRKPMWVVPVD